MGLSTKEVIRQVKRIEMIHSPLARWEASHKAPARVSAFYRAANCFYGDFVEYHLSRVHTDDLPALLNEPTVLGSKIKTAAAKREIRRRGGAVPALRFLCPECGRRFPTVEKTLLHKLRAHQKEEG